MAVVKAKLLTRDKIDQLAIKLASGWSIYILYVQHDNLINSAKCQISCGKLKMNK